MFMIMGNLAMQQFNLRDNRGLVLYGAVKLVLIALFSLSLTYANRADANGEIACTGDDLITVMAQSEADTLATLRTEAAATSFGSSRFWRISKSGLPDSWLFGTMHIADEMVVALPATIENAYQKADTILVEITDMLDPKKARASILELKHLTLRLDGSTIEADLSPQQMGLLKTAVQARSMPYELAIRMQPWMLAPAVGRQLCEISARAQGKPFLDEILMKRALSEGKILIGLETTKEQLTAIASMPKSFQIKSLIETLEKAEMMNDLKETMKTLYVQGKIGMIMPLIRYVSRNFSSNEGTEEFQTKLVVNRNIKMAERAAEYFTKGNVFMAVGALHLPGEYGLAALLQGQGYRVKAVRDNSNSE